MLSNTISHQFFISGIFALSLPFILALSGCQSDKSSTLGSGPAESIPGKGVNVYAAGDIADCKKVKPANSGAAKTAALIEARLANDPEAAVLSLGDHTYPIGLLDEFTSCYEPTWGRFKKRTYPTPGNHEYYTPKAVGYYSYFDEIAGPEQRGYYSFRLGSWHVISLNSYLKPNEHQAQMEWLKADLEKNKTRCTLAYWHHPLFSSGGHGSSPRMKDAWKLLVEAGADVVLSSHDHDYERFAPQDENGREDGKRGMRQFVVGTGGAELTPFWFRKFNSEVSDNSSFGVLKLNLKPTGYEWEFLPVDEDGFRDRGAALCNAS
ncbi:MAG TPA: metallophosphoesterase [Noviherbaspirillum sp.]|uniref:metallophosphoesterase family protein n=1 Tax=Noviherbaspirillum sp. TaxID=1926288 RepID=UPI002DDCC7DE|nr:metallophosphoesterase [Noviherbaspirillum sp.]HEV2612426.1 metallophosphoesterase [Noviherbaspirillum sp.]